MTSLLESRCHQRRVRLLSRKARECDVHDQEPSYRHLPVTTPNNTEYLSNRQRSQRERRRKEKDRSNINNAPDQVTSSLLDSRAHHRCIRVLSRKAREHEIHDQEPSYRRLPVSNPNNTELLLNRQHSQRERRRRERDQRSTDNVIESANGSIGSSQSSITNQIFCTTLPPSSRQQAQQWRWLEERVTRQRSQDDGPSLVGTHIITNTVVYS